MDAVEPTISSIAFIQWRLHHKHHFLGEEEISRGKSSSKSLTRLGNNEGDGPMAIIEAFCHFQSEKQLNPNSLLSWWIDR